VVKVAATVVRRAISGGRIPARPRRHVDSGVKGSGSARYRRLVESGGFGDGVKDEASFKFDAGGPGHTGPGDAGGPPSAEIEVAQQLLMANLGYEFGDKALLAAALTHPSWRNERAEVTLDNQRIEFLGDLVLGLAVGDLLLLRLPDAKEGEVSVLKAKLVRQSTLANVATVLGVGPALRLGRGEERSGGRDRPAVLADAVEAVFAAVFIEAGYDIAREVVAGALADSLELLLAAAGKAGADSTMALHASTDNYKTALQEWLAAARAEPARYELVRRIGPDHDQRFRVRVLTRVDGTEWQAQGEGRSVKSAENAAAAELFAELATDS